MKTEKGISMPPTQPDNFTQDTPQDKNTERNNEKLPINCTEHPRKMVLTQIQQIKIKGENLQLNKLNDQKQKIKLNLTQNRFKGLEVMDIAEQQSEINKPTK